MKIKDDRFDSLPPPKKKITLSERVTALKFQTIKTCAKISSFVEDKFLRKFDNFVAKHVIVDESYQTHFYTCKFCGRDKYFPCTEVKDMELKTGLCPDKTCARELLKLGGTPEYPIEYYPETRL